MNVLAEIEQAVHGSATVLHDRDKDRLVLPTIFPSLLCGVLLVVIAPSIAEGVVTISVELGRATPTRCTAIEHLLGELNARSAFLVFSIAEGGRVQADVSVDLVTLSSLPHAAQRSVARLLEWVSIALPPLQDVMRARRKRTARVDREVSKILTDSKF